MLERGPAVNPLFGAWLEAGQQAGFRVTDDVNGFRQEGFAAFDKNVSRGRRLSAARLSAPSSIAPNLNLVTRANVHRLTFDGNRCVGLELEHRRKIRHVKAGEVILSAGAQLSSVTSTFRYW